MSEALSIARFNDYKHYIRARIENADSARGLVSKFADAAGCQRSYFSQVINSHIHLTPDHAIHLAEFWNLSELESEYFCLLIDHARAATPKLKNKIQRRMRSIRHSLEDLGPRFKVDQIEPGEMELIYYSSWIFAAVHVLVSIPAYQRPEAIAARLNLPVNQVLSVLSELERFQMVKRANPKWQIGKAQIHLPSSSLLNSINHSQWRQRATNDSQMRVHEGLHYTSVASMEINHFLELKANFLSTIDRSRKIIASSGEEEAFCMTLDFFKI